ncbi:hypothetical protein LCO01nite_16190 [Lapidilactobacillus concavus]|nr:hypothetical protein LCO01nite_16190 [Lapidilactobacillus concavus]
MIRGLNPRLYSRGFLLGVKFMQEVCHAVLDAHFRIKLATVSKFFGQ